MRFSFFILQVNLNENSKPWFEEYSGTIASIVVICLFIFERIITSREKKKERKSNWYYSVIILPHIECINHFFQTYSKQIIEAHSNILSSLTNINPIVSQQAKTIFFKKFRILINDFEFDFLMTIYTFNIVRFNSLQRIIEDMNDEILVFLDRDSSQIQNTEALELIVKNKKSIFFDELYNGLNERPR